MKWTPEVRARAERIYSRRTCEAICSCECRHDPSCRFCSREVRLETHRCPLPNRGNGLTQMLRPLWECGICGRQFAPATYGGWVETRGPTEERFCPTD